MIGIGIKGRQETTVTAANVATNVGSGKVKVFATPMMIALMEKASVLSIEPCLEEGQSSVGTHISVSHCAATPIGMKVWAEAEDINPEALILMAPGSVIKEACQGGHFFGNEFDPKNPPEYIKCFHHFKLGRNHLLQTQYKAIYSNSRMHIVEGENHLIIKKQKEVIRIILDFLKNTLNNTCKEVCSQQIAVAVKDGIILEAGIDGKGPEVVTGR